MKKEINIFYSWQSDLKFNKNFIQSCIAKAIKEVKKKYSNEIILEINIDRDTKNNSGSPQITNTIFNKIKTCDIFISDVTIINKNNFLKYINKRITPNPNVLIELGYASALVGWQRIICVNDLKFSSIEELPFDIRGHRISTFNSKNMKEKENLTNTLKSAIESIIKNYDNIIIEQKKSKIYEHDFKIYQSLNQICDEQSLLDSISAVTISLFTNQYYLELWDNLKYYYSLSENKFLDKEVDNLMELFLKELNEFYSLIIPNFHSNDDSQSEYMEYLNKKHLGIQMTEDEIFSYKQSRHFNVRKEPYREESWPEADRRIWKLQDELEKSSVQVKSAYRNLVLKIKENRL